MVIRLLEHVDRTERAVANPLREAGFVSAIPERDTIAVHLRLPGYRASPLLDLPHIAVSLGLERLWLKDESSRLGLPAFKILGASWAVINAVQQRLGISPADWSSIDELAKLAERLRPMTLACATDGNHGRAVARMARWLGFEAVILVPDNPVRGRRSSRYRRLVR